jgi:hypothetical protein
LHLWTKGNSLNNKTIMEKQTKSKTRKIAAWVIIGLVGALVIMSATMKLTHAEELVTNFTKWGLIDNLTFIGIGELIFIILFIIPRTSSLGFLLLTAHFGGAIATHLQHQESYVMPAIILTFIWIGNYLRNPEMLASFTKK